MQPASIPHYSMKTRTALLWFSRHRWHAPTLVQQISDAKMD